MEYPMLAVEARGQAKQDLYEVVTHEIGHNWFPILVGSNERRHPWMDEGFNTFISDFSMARRFPGLHPEENNRATVEQALRNGRIPLDLPPDRVPPQLLGFTQYTKPSVGLHLLRSEILGPAVFDSAFRTYIARWANKTRRPRTSSAR